MHSPTLTPEEQIEEAYCTGCQKLIEDGSVVSFGNGIWHLGCFRCAKCRRPIETDSDLLLLSEGEPICKTCSYTCHLCHQAITDEAIMTGEEAYHSYCFECIQCGKQIDDLVYAKTSSGIYCMTCHEERAAASARNHPRRKGSQSSRSNSRNLSRKSSRVGRSNALRPRSGASSPGVGSRSTSRATSPAQGGGSGQGGHVDFPDEVAHLPPHPSQDTSLASVTLELELADLRSQLTEALKANEDLHLKYTSVQDEVSQLRLEAERDLRLRQSDEEKAQHWRREYDKVMTEREAERAQNKVALEEAAVLREATMQKKESSISGSTSPPPTLDGSSGDANQADRREVAERYELLRRLVEELTTQKEKLHRELTSLASEREDLAMEVDELKTQIRTLVETKRTIEAEDEGLIPRVSSGQGGEPPMLPPRPVISAERTLSERDAATFISSNGNVSTNITQERNGASGGSLAPLLTTGSLSEGAVPVVSPPPRKESAPVPTPPRTDSNRGTPLTLGSVGARKGRAGISSPQEGIPGSSAINRRPIVNGGYSDTISSPTTPYTNHHNSSSGGSGGGAVNVARKFKWPGRKKANVQGSGGVGSGSGGFPGEETSSGSLDAPGSPHTSTHHLSAPVLPGLGELAGESGDGVGRTSLSSALFQDDSEEMEGRSSRDEKGGPPMAPGLQLASVSVSASPSISTAISNSSSIAHSTTSPPISLDTLVSGKESMEDKGVDRSVMTTSGSGSGAVGSSGKIHMFVLHKYLRPAKCHSCQEKMWGQEMRCQACGFHIHQRCTQYAPHNCLVVDEATDNPYAMPKVPMMGNELGKQLELEGRSVPRLISRCVDAVEARGMTIEGIYRKTGPNSQLRAILVCLARDEMPDLTDSTEHPDITSVTSALKLYLRELPEPLLTYELYPQFIDAARSVDSSDPRASLDRFRSLLLALPRGHRTTLAFLMAHLSRVQAQHEINLMTTKNLGVVFGPTLMRTTDPDRELLEMGTKNAVVEYIIEYADELLGTAK